MPVLPSEPLSGEVTFPMEFTNEQEKPNAEGLYDSPTDSSSSDLNKPDGEAYVYQPRNKFFAFLNKLVPHGGALSAIYNLASVTLGSGIFSLPYAFKSTGIFTAAIVLVAITIFTIYSVYLLMVAVGKTGNRLRCYEALARGLLGRGWDYLAAFNMWMFCFGSCVSYVISIGDLIHRAADDPSVNEFVRSTWGIRVLTIVVWACVMLPLSLPKQVNSLRYASVIGVTFMMYFVVVIIIHSALNGFENGKLKHELNAVRGGNEALLGFSTFLFAYLCQTNCFEVYAESKDPSPARMTGYTAISMSICSALYIVAGFFGYADYGNELTGSVLRYYNVRNDVMVAVGYVGLGFKLCVSFAICMLPTRDAVYYCLSEWLPMFRSVRTVPFWLNSLICGFMAVVALVLGLFIPDVEIVFSLVGSFCGGFLGFIFPALFIMYAGDWSLKTVGWFHWVSTYVLLIAGVIAVVFGTVAAIFDII